VNRMTRSAIPALALAMASATCTALHHRDRSTGYVMANGINTYYERYGDGPPLILVHGAAMVAEAWRPQIEAFARHFTVYVPERRGVGRTGDIDGEWSYDGMAADTAAFLDAVKVRKAFVVGMSDGGNIGLILAYTRPDLVRRLVVSGANINPEGLGELKDEFAGMTPDQLLASAPPQVSPWLELQRRVSPDAGQNLIHSFAKMKRMWLNFEITPSQLARITVPTLVMGGDHDMIPVPHTVEIWASIPGATLCIAPDASHFWLEEKPELANEIILSFLLDSRIGIGPQAADESAQPDDGADRRDRPALE